MLIPFIYKETAPTLALRPYIRCYWQYRKRFTPGKTKKIFPDSSYELIWVEKGQLFVDGEHAPRLFTGGLNKKPLLLSGDGVVVLWAVRFLPWGFAPFGDVEIAMPEKCLPAAQALARPLPTQLTNALSHSNSRTISPALDDLFLRHLIGQRVRPGVIEDAAAMLLNRKGAVTVKELAEYCRISERQLERRIAKATGTTPQQIASRIRFEHVRSDLLMHPEITLTASAHKHGYVDQSHLTKEFQRYTDLTPVAYRAQFADLKEQMARGEIVVANNPVTTNE